MQELNSDFLFFVVNSFLRSPKFIILTLASVISACTGIEPEKPQEIKQLLLANDRESFGLDYNSVSFEEIIQNSGKTEESPGLLSSSSENQENQRVLTHEQSILKAARVPEEYHEKLIALSRRTSFSSDSMFFKVVLPTYIPSGFELVFLGYVKAGDTEG